MSAAAVDGILRLAQASFRAGSYEAAMQAYTEGLSHGPDDATLLLGRAHCYIKVGEESTAASAETMFELAVLDAESAAKDGSAAPRANAARAEALFMLGRREEAQGALDLAVAAAPTDAGTLQAQMRLRGAAAAGSSAAGKGASRLSKITAKLGKRTGGGEPGPAAGHAVPSAAALRPSDAVVEQQLAEVLTGMGLAPGTAERAAAEALGLEEKWAMVESAQLKRAAEQSAKAQGLVAAQAALAKRQPGGGLLERGKAALTGASADSREVGLITHWDGSSSVADQPKAGQDDSGEGQGAAEGGGGDTRWMCVEPDISWQSVDFVGADEVSDSSTGSAADDASRYTVYRMMAHTVDGRSWEVAKRYSEFEVFRQELLAAGCSISHLSFPSKTTWSRQSRTDSKLVAQRMAQLQAWMAALIGTYPDHVLIGVFLHADSDLAQLETLRLQWRQPDRVMTYEAKGWSVLHTAAQRGDLTWIEDAVEEGFVRHGGSDDGAREPLDLDAVDCHGQTALHRAAALGHADIVFALLGAGASPSVVSSAGHTPLHLAARDGGASIASQLCKATKARAAARGDSSCGLEVATQTGDTALHYAAFGCHPGVVQVLLAQGANPHATNMVAETPLDSLARARGASVGDARQQAASSDAADLEQSAGNLDEFYRLSPIKAEADLRSVSSEAGSEEETDAQRSVALMLQQAMRLRPMVSSPRPPPRPAAVEGSRGSTVALQLALAAVESGATLRCVGRTGATVRSAPQLDSAKVGSLAVGAEVAPLESVLIDLDDGGADRQLRFRVAGSGQQGGWVSLRSAKSGGLLFESAEPSPEPAPAASSPVPTWKLSRDLSVACARGGSWCAPADLRSAAARCHAFYQANCLGGAGAAQLLASPTDRDRGDADEAVEEGASLTLYDDDSWLQDDVDSPLSTSTRSDGTAPSPHGGASPVQASPSPVAAVAQQQAGRVALPSPTPSPPPPPPSPSVEDLKAAVAEVQRFAPEAYAVLTEAIAVDQAADRDVSAALDLYTQALHVGMGVVRSAQQDKVRASFAGLPCAFLTELRNAGADEKEFGT